MQLKAQQQRKKFLEIYNLEFPPYIKKLTIGDYKFKRIGNYKEASDNMMWLLTSYGSEFDRQTKTGSHQVTAIVEVPQTEKKCELPWGDKKSTQLYDVLFLLTIFTGRNVFEKNWDDENDIAIIQDYRMHQYGGQLITSLNGEWVFMNIDTGEFRSEEEIKGMDNVEQMDWNKVDIGFEKNLNQVLNKISSKSWQDEYEGGYFLLLFKSAMQRQIIGTSFILCWTVWEHIFAIKNRNWLDDKTIEQMSSDKKISYILNKYFLKDIDDGARKNIQRINKTRNRLVHFGKKTDNVDFAEMNMFIRLTEQLIATILGLRPSNLFNSFDELDNFLKKSKH
ncbi:MAG: hypothetical protein KAQ85_01840 [Thermodesulfovibrionia bacterium]|nr:hypothetical protein [Thermodesulfovibrionia bacterium]MCK5306356.1 hypothetical protein [Candidatus Omnitrophota bacterium]